MDKDVAREYSSVCSAATLQSDRKGFFQSYIDSVHELAGSKWLDQFAKLTLDNDRLAKCYDDFELHDAVHGVLRNVTPLFRAKTAGLARHRRLDGEVAASKGKLEQALLLLNQSVIKAPSSGVDSSVDDGLSLSLALWSRARVLYQLSEFNMCLADLQLCIKEKIPESLRAEVFCMMAQCYNKIGETSKARVSLQVSFKLLKQDDSSLKKKIETELVNLSLNKEELQKTKQNQEEVLESEHPQLPGLSLALAVRSGQATGRYVVARGPISSGELLAVEKPYTACLLPPKFGSHCYHCFTRLRSAVGCRQCAGVAFCSAACRDNALCYHQYECQFMDLMIGSGMSVLCHMALRTITQQDYQYWERVRAHQPVTPDYNRMASLVTHADKRDPKDFLSRTLMSLFLLTILDKSHYIPPGVEKGDKLMGMRMFLASIILHLLQCLQFNAHEIYETLYKAEFDFENSKINFIGVGVYPSVALFNHDCYPAVTRYFCGKEIVIHAVRPLKPGETVAENYGPVFTVRSKAERQKSLAGRYWFQCSCIACIEDWPKLSALDDSSTFRIRCKNNKCSGFVSTTKDAKKKSQCPRCLQDINVMETMLLIQSYNNDFSQGLALMNNGQLQEAAKIFSTYSDLMEAVCKPPNKNLSLAHEGLRSCLAYHHNKHLIK